MQGSLPFQRRPNGLFLNKNENANLTRFLLLLNLLVDATHQKTRADPPHSKPRRWVTYGDYQRSFRIQDQWHAIDKLSPYSVGMPLDRRLQNWQESHEPWANHEQAMSKTIIMLISKDPQTMVYKKRPCHVFELLTRAISSEMLTKRSVWPIRFDWQKSKLIFLGFFFDDHSTTAR